MQTTVVAFHRGGLARYLVSLSAGGGYEAHLLRYDGKPLFSPPPRLTFAPEALGQGEAYASLVEELYKVAQKRIPLPQAQDSVNAR